MRDSGEWPDDIGGKRSREDFDLNRDRVQNEMQRMYMAWGSKMESMPWAEVVEARVSLGTVYRMAARNAGKTRGIEEYFDKLWLEEIGIKA